MIDELELRLGRVLTSGTRATTWMLALGLAATFAFPTSPFTDALLTVGLLVLLITPVARVVVSVVGFVRARDWRFVLYTGIVLVLLTTSFIAAFG